jgi:ABC-2 type transport system ATP-binding protein
MSMAELALVARGLHKRFGAVTALDDLSLALEHGEIYGLLGPNGAGKTTALRIICGLLMADAGDGHCLTVPLGSRPLGLGYLPQGGGLYEDLTVSENLRFFARAYGLSHPLDRVSAALIAHGLTEHARQRVGTLSGGWRQRVALAAALMHEPRLLLLDEPTAGLDAQARERLWQQLRMLSVQAVTILVTTHYADEAERCDRIGYLTAGRLRAEGPPGRLFHELGLTVWRIAVSGEPHEAPPQIDALHFIRDSDSWRVVARAVDVPPAISEWCARAGATPERTTPRLGDALLWLAGEQR